MIELYRKYQEIINYLIFGVLTTLVSIGSYYILSLVFDLENDFLFILINILSWFLAVLFAYITNKKYVFKSDNRRFWEFIRFVFSRLATLLIELIGMYIIVKILKLNDVIAKTLMQFIVIILNYLISKIIVFKE